MQLFHDNPTKNGSPGAQSWVRAPAFGNVQLALPVRVEKLAPHLRARTAMRRGRAPRSLELDLSTHRLSSA